MTLKVSLFDTVLEENFLPSVPYSLDAACSSKIVPQRIASVHNQQRSQQDLLAAFSLENSSSHSCDGRLARSQSLSLLLPLSAG